MHRLSRALVLAGALCWSSAGLAADWPNHAVRLILPVPAGSASDFTARLLAERLSTRWAQPVVVENRPGADGTIGVSAFLHMHDDHTLLFAISAVATVHPVLNDKLPYDPVRDLVPIASAAEIVIAIAASEKSKIRSLADLAREARAAPGKLNWASSPGLPPVVVGAFMRSSGLDLTFISYRELAPALQDLAEGRIDIYVHALSVLIPQVQAGRARLLAVASQDRAVAAPDIPTVGELGFTGLSMDGLCGFFGASEMPQAVRAKIAADVMFVAGEPTVRERLAGIGQAARPGTSSEFAALLANSRQRITGLAKLYAK